MKIKYGFFNTVNRGLSTFRKDLKRHHIIFSLLGGIGVVLFWHGIWGIADIYVNPFQSVILGVIVLWITGLLILQLIGSEAIEEDLDKENKILDKGNDIIKILNKLEFTVLQHINDIKIYVDNKEKGK